jgi:hypothetical protein
MQPSQDILFRTGMVLLYKPTRQTQFLKLVGSEDFQEEASFILEHMWREDHYAIQGPRFNSHFHNLFAHNRPLFPLQRRRDRGKRKQLQMSRIAH